MSNAQPHTHSASCTCHLSRRALLVGASALCGTAVLPRGARAQGASIIDTHHHFYPPPYQQAWMDWENAHKIPHFPSSQDVWTRDKAVAEMDKNGIRTAMLSLHRRRAFGSTPGRKRQPAWCASAATMAPKWCRTFPDASACSRRCRCSTSIRRSRKSSTPSMRCNADGVGLQSNYGDKWLGHASFKPVWDELNRRKAVVYVHPLVANCCGNLSVGTFPAVLEVPHDTTRTITSLLLSGTFAASARHQVAVLPCGRNHADDGGPHRCVLRQKPEARGVRAGRNSRRAAAAQLRHGQRDIGAHHGGTVEVRARLTDHLRHRLPLFPARSDTSRLPSPGSLPPT